MKKNVFPEQGERDGDERGGRDEIFSVLNDEIPRGWEDKYHMKAERLLKEMEKRFSVEHGQEIKTVAQQIFDERNFDPEKRVKFVEKLLTGELEAIFDYSNMAERMFEIQSDYLSYSSRGENLKFFWSEVHKIVNEELTKKNRKAG